MTDAENDYAIADDAERWSFLADAAAADREEWLATQRWEHGESRDDSRSAWDPDA